jgi:hypothetical protein
MMTPILRRVCLVALCSAASALAAPPAPQPPPTQTAEQLFKRARDLLAAKKFSEACPLFEKSQAMEPALGTLLNLADCLEQEGKPASAFVVFNEAAGWASRTKEAKREEVALKRAQALKAKVTFVAVELAAPTPSATAEIFTMPVSTGAVALQQWKLDGALQAVPLNPGSYLLRARAPGRVDVELPFEVKTVPGPLKLTVPVMKAEAAALAADMTPPPMPAPAPLEAPVRVQRSGRTTSSVVGIANVSVGAALLIGSAVALGYSTSIADKVNRQQAGQPDQLSPTVTRSEYNTVRTLYPASIVGLGVGAAVLGTGVFLLLRDSSSAVAFNVGVSGDGAMVSARGTF